LDPYVAPDSPEPTRVDITRVRVDRQNCSEAPDEGRSATGLSHTRALNDAETRTRQQLRDRNSNYRDGGHADVFATCAARRDSVCG
jgi:hypothetical protein